MRKKILWLLLAGNICMSIKLFASPFGTVPESIEDFLKGFGIALIFSAAVMMVRSKKLRHCENTEQ